MGAAGRLWDVGYEEDALVECGEFDGKEEMVQRQQQGNNWKIYLLHISEYNIKFKIKRKVHE